MLKYGVALFLVLFLFSCKQKHHKNSITEEVSLGPIIHDSLSNEQLSQIQYIQKTFYEVLPISLEETITNFRRDQNPNNEINIWLHMAKAYEAFTITHSEEDDVELRKEALKVIVMRSMLSEEEIFDSGYADFKVLSETDIAELLANYTLEPRPLVIHK